MRKFFTLMMVAALAALAAFPVMAQEDTNTIADIVVASTEAETPEFTTLLTAVQAADPAVLELLADPEAELTVFAPTDAAFAALAEALGEEEFNAILEDTALLTAILQYHVVPGVVPSADVVAALEENEGSFMVASAQGIRFEVAQEDAESPITVASAPLNLEMLDIEADNGIVHVVDAVMVPPLDTIADVVVASAEGEEPEFTTLLTAVQAADPAVLELLADPLAGVTVFAPTDAAFEALGEETLTAVIEDEAMLTDILQYHVTSGVVYSDTVAELVAEEAIEIEMANGAMAEITPELTIAGASIVMTDIETLNGVIHVIDAVMLPPEDNSY